MHWKVIDYKVLQKSHLARVLESGKCKVIAYAMTQVNVRLDDKLSLAKDDFYRVNNTDDKKIRFIRANKFTAEEWRAVTLVKRHP